MYQFSCNSQGSIRQPVSVNSNSEHGLSSSARIGDAVKAIAIYSRRDAGSAEVLLAVGAFSRELLAAIYRIRG